MDETPFRMDTRGAFAMPEQHRYDAGYGLTEATIDYICDAKGEPDWLRQFRKDALRRFREMPMPTHWAPEGIRGVDFEKIRYYLAHGTAPRKSWDEVPEDVKRTFERLGVPEQERAFLAGVDAQYDSETAYNNMRSELSKQGVIFDFLDCVRSRRQFALNESNGHHSATIVNMGVCALRLGRTLHFDPKTQLFINDDAANRLVNQPMRGDWGKYI